MSKNRKEIIQVKHSPIVGIQIQYVIDYGQPVPRLFRGQCAERLQPGAVIKPNVVLKCGNKQSRDTKKFINTPTNNTTSANHSKHPDNYTIKYVKTYQISPISIDDDASNFSVVKYEPKLKRKSNHSKQKQRLIKRLHNQGHDVLDEKITPNLISRYSKYSHNHRNNFKHYRQR